MNFCSRQFNLYLSLLAAVALLCGCQTHRKDKEPVAALRIHIESTGNAEGSGQTVSVLRNDPVLVTIADEPILTESSIINADVINVPGGFAVDVQFDETGTWILEQYSASNPGKHFVIFGQWGEKLAQGRWLAAPLITHRIAGGLLAFTPDASREEADELALGLNNVAKKTIKGKLK